MVFPLFLKEGQISTHQSFVLSVLKQFEILVTNFRLDEDLSAGGIG